MEGKLRDHVRCILIYISCFITGCIFILTCKKEYSDRSRTFKLNRVFCGAAQFINSTVQKTYVTKVVIKICEHQLYLRAMQILYQEQSPTAVLQLLGPAGHAPHIGPMGQMFAPIVLTLKHQPKFQPQMNNAKDIQAPVEANGVVVASLAHVSCTSDLPTGSPNHLKCCLIEMLKDIVDEAAKAPSSFP